MKAAGHCHFDALNLDSTVAPLRLPPLEEIAKEAGVSLSTVDRALHHRPGVSARSVQRITAAIQSLQRTNKVPAANDRKWLLCFLLVSEDPGISQQVQRELANSSDWLEEQGLQVHIRSVESLSASAAANAVKRVRGQYDAIVATLPDSPLVHDAVQRVIADGTCFVSLASEISCVRSQNFAGISNISAGQTAAALVGRLVRSTGEGQVGILIGSHEMKSQTDRLQGFRETMLNEFPKLELLPPVECHDRDSCTQLATTELIAQRPRLVALYTAGAGNRGVHTALKAAAQRGISWVGHELTSHTRAALLDGSASAVIGQSLARATRAACRMAINQLMRRTAKDGVDPPRIEIYLKENLP